MTSNLFRQSLNSANGVSGRSLIRLVENAPPVVPKVLLRTKLWGPGLIF